MASFATSVRLLTSSIFFGVLIIAFEICSSRVIDSSIPYLIVLALSKAFVLIEKSHLKAVHRATMAFIINEFNCHDSESRAMLGSLIYLNAFSGILLMF